MLFYFKQLPIFEQWIRSQFHLSITAKSISGTFDRVAGAGSNSMFFLTVDKYHVGQLFNSDFGWQFYSNSTPSLNELSEFFGEYIVAWYQ